MQGEGAGQTARKASPLWGKAFAVATKNGYRSKICRSTRFLVISSYFSSSMPHTPSARRKDAGFLYKIPVIPKL